MKCPVCNTRFVPAPDGIRGPWKRQEWQEFGFDLPATGTAMPPLAAGSSYVRELPTRAPTIESDVKVPAFQSLICATISSAIALLIAVPVTLEMKWSLWIPPAAIVGCGVGGFGIAWFLLLGFHRRLLWHVEEITGLDLVDGDGHEGKPEGPTIHIDVTERTPGGVKTTFDELPASEEMLVAIAQAIYVQGVPFSRRELARATDISEDRIGAIQSEMQARGYARYKGSSPQAGYELTRKGQVLLESRLSPSPTDDVGTGEHTHHHPPPPPPPL